MCVCVCIHICLYLSLCPQKSSSVCVCIYMQVTVILEIMIRKCGSAAVEFVTPDKYKSFVKTVLQVLFSARLFFSKFVLSIFS